MRFTWRMCAFVFLLFVPLPAWGNSINDIHTTMFAEYFSRKISAASILPVLSADEDELRQGKIPSLTVCIERAFVENVVYDRLLLVLSDVLFTRDQQGIHVRSYKKSYLSGNITKKDFFDSLRKNMSHFDISELELKNGKVMVKGVYEKKLMFKMRALVRLTGKYVMEKGGAAKIRFDDSTNDNVLISAADVGRAIADAAPVLSFRKFFSTPEISEVRVDHDMVWFSAK